MFNKDTHTANSITFKNISLVSKFWVEKIEREGRASNILNAELKYFRGKTLVERWMLSGFYNQLISSAAKVPLEKV